MGLLALCASPTACRIDIVLLSESCSIWVAADWALLGDDVLSRVIVPLGGNDAVRSNSMLNPVRQCNQRIVGPVFETKDTADSSVETSRLASARKEP